MVNRLLLQFLWICSWSHKNCSVLLLLFETGGQAYFSYFFLNNKLVILSITANVHGQDKKTFMHLERTYSANKRITMQYSVCYVPLITVEWVSCSAWVSQWHFCCIHNLIKPGDVDVRKPERSRKFKMLNIYRKSKMPSFLFHMQCQISKLHFTSAATVQIPKR